jgi:murein DD-endopeptidase MepM/ murein hydrolase activator NlpD
MTWTWPLRAPALLPDEVGRFGHVREHDVHTGVDLYCELGTEVVAVEGGVVVAVEWFTGRNVPAPDGQPSDWWNDTMVVLVAGKSGVVAYGEVSPRVAVGDKVRAGQVVAVVEAAVLRVFKGRPMVMLHLELYDRLLPPDATGSHVTWWGRGEDQPDGLLDPTCNLGCAPAFDLAAYDGQAYRDPLAPSKPSRWWAVWGGNPPR